MKSCLTEVIGTSTASSTAGNSYFGLAIGFRVMVGAFVFKIQNPGDN